MSEIAKDIQKKEVETEEGVERTRTKKVYAPPVDIVEKKDELILIADIPGVDANSLEVTLEKNILSIWGKTDLVMPARHRLAVAEYGVGDYHRSFRLSDEIDKDRIQAVVSNGVLRLVLPKAAAVRTRTIEVTAAG
jgi:HSP20 family protein